MMTQTAFVIHIKIAWWVKPYICMITLMHRLTGREVDVKRFTEQCRRGVVIDAEA
ncbi:hypothetical protein FHR87_002920 [Azomonas macrocytogenes]|uniref:Uncharacterized protein n=1 Tax=Azomonas macrocytogenes TaxID=69962 RepID=A0A839T6M8_AZOMA|nr:hypothetical protein [Azomonas macrocytogenes]